MQIYELSSRLDNRTTLFNTDSLYHC